MNDLAGPIALGLVGLWIAYLVPHKLRHRQQLLESRADDRYSAALRVVAVSDRPRGRRAAEPERTVATRSTSGLLTPGTGVRVVVTRARGGTAVERPTATQDRAATEAARRAAQVRAAHAAAAARRAAAAKRRAALATVLLLATLGAWVGVAATSVVTPLYAAVPTLLLGSVLVLGRRAVLAGRRADADYAARFRREQENAARLRTGAQRAVPAPRQTGAGRAVHPSDLETQMFAAIVADRGEEGTTARHALGDGSAPETEGWSPVPVPRPTYTMKATAPRREPLPLENLEGSTAAAVERPAVERPVVEETAPETTGSLDLDAVLAKRRASGE